MTFLALHFTFLQFSNCSQQLLMYRTRTNFTNELFFLFSPENETRTTTYMQISNTDKHEQMTKGDHFQWKFNSICTTSLY